MNDYPSNSKRGGEPPAPKHVARVTSGTAVRRNQGIGSRIKSIFVVGTARGAGEYAVKNVVVPAIQDMLADAMHSVVDGIFQGDASRSRRRPTVNPGATPPKINYQGYSAVAPVAQQHRTISTGARARHDFSEILIQDRGAAREVLDQMLNIVEQYGVVSVADLYVMCDVQAEHTDSKWGWTKLGTAKIVRLRNGAFMLDLPDPEELG